MSGKVVLVTGGTDGLGLSLASRLVGEGAAVAVCGRDPDRLRSAAATLGESGGETLVLRADVARAEDLEAFVDAVVSRWGRIDGIVHNAGRAAAGTIESVDDATWVSDIDLKLLAAVRLSRLALPYLRASRGAILFTLAMAAKAPGGASEPSSVTRAAGMALMKALSKELAPDGVRVNAVLIGLIESGQWERAAKAAGTGVETFYDRTAKGAQIPLGRFGRADEFADLASFLLSPCASYLTGAAINLDGGLSPAGLNPHLLRGRLRCSFVIGPIVRVSQPPVGALRERYCGALVILTVDFGTTITKVGLWGDSGLVTLARSELSTAHPHAGWSEQDPLRWWTTLVIACAEARAQAPRAFAEVDVVACTGARQTFAPVTHRGDPIGKGILWSDHRAADAARRLADRVGGDDIIRARTGIPLDAGSVAAKLAWLAENEPDRLDAADLILSPRDLVVYRLTDQVVTDATFASRSGLYDFDGNAVASWPDRRSASCRAWCRPTPWSAISSRCPAPSSGCVRARPWSSGPVTASARSSDRDRRRPIPW